MSSFRFGLGMFSSSAATPDESLAVMGADTLSYEERKGEATRERKWEDIVRRWQAHVAAPAVLRRYIAEGVPVSRRGEVWPLLMKARALSEKFQPGVYQRLLTLEGEDDYHIRKDLHRTLPHEPLFEEENGPGQAALFNLMRAYAAYDTDLGYVQGMAFPAGMLLLHARSEEDAFWCFVQLMFVYRWRDIYKPGTPRLLLLLFKMERLLQTHHPDLHAHLLEQGVSLQSCAAQWFITVFVYRTPEALCKRVWDLFLFDGEPVLLKALLVMMDVCKDTLRKLEFQDLVPQYMCLPELTLQLISLDALMRRVADLTLDADLLQRLEQEFVASMSASGPGRMVSASEVPSPAVRTPSGRSPASR